MDPQILVRKGGLEPPRFYPPDPKSGASANSATFAFLHKSYQGYNFSQQLLTSSFPGGKTNANLICLRHVAGPCEFNLESTAICDAGVPTPKIRNCCANCCQADGYVQSERHSRMGRIQKERQTGLQRSSSG